MTKKQGKLNKFMSIMLMTKITLDIRIWDLSILNLVSLYVEKICSEKINYMQINKHNKANYFCLKTKFYQKGNFQNFGLHTLNPGGRWTLDAGLWTLDAGRWTLDPGRYT